MIRSRYDPKADAAYFYLTDGQPHESEDVAPNVTIDFDASGHVVGLEVLQASRTLAVGPWSESLSAETDTKVLCADKDVTVVPTSVEHKNYDANELFDYDALKKNMVGNEFSTVALQSQNPVYDNLIQIVNSSFIMNRGDDGDTKEMSHLYDSVEISSLKNIKNSRKLTVSTHGSEINWVETQRRLRVLGTKGQDK